MESSEEVIPRRMLRNGRSIIDHFPSNEAIFHRFRHDHRLVHDSGQIFFNIPMPRTSVNRSHPDGQWNDVLLVKWPQYRDWGVFSFKAGDLPAYYQTAPDHELHFRLVHDPVDDNYYHSEIRAYRNIEEMDEKLKLKPAWKLWFRLSLSNVATILNEPESE
jgi:hypothetical protein